MGPEASVQGVCLSGLLEAANLFAIVLSQSRMRDTAGRTRDTQSVPRRSDTVSSSLTQGAN